MLIKLFENTYEKYHRYQLKMKNESIGSDMIENFIVLTNTNVANFFDKNKLIFPFRIRELFNSSDIYDVIIPNTEEMKKDNLNLHDSNFELRFDNTENVNNYITGLNAYCRATRPIIDKLSRIVQGMEHSFMLNSNIDEEELAGWKDYLFEVERKEGPIIKKLN